MMQVPSAAEIADALSAPFVVCPHCGNGTGSGLGLIDDFLMGKSLRCGKRPPEAVGLVLGRTSGPLVDRPG